MQTNFSLAQLSNSDVKDANEIIRSCVHCGFCNATCPTYSLLGDELDGPRGRIYLIKEMLEANRAASETDVKHLDRCLSCLSCMTTCPSGVNYLHLVDHGRRHIEKTYKRKFKDRLTRELLGKVLPSKGLFRLALLFATISRIFGPLLPKQYQKMFNLDEVKLTFTEDALAAIADKAILRETGARGLRSILEDILIDTMYTLPDMENVEEVIINRDVVEDKAKPIILYSKVSRNAKSSAS